MSLPGAPGGEDVCAAFEVGWSGTWKSGEGCVVLVVPTTPVKVTLNYKERSCDTRGSCHFHKFRKDSGRWCWQRGGKGG